CAAPPVFRGAPQRRVARGQVVEALQLATAPLLPRVNVCCSAGSCQLADHQAWENLVHASAPYGSGLHYGTWGSTPESPPPGHVVMTHHSRQLREAHV